jgi:peptide/nickel transport system substrate-binding protein
MSRNGLNPVSSVKNLFSKLKTRVFSQKNRASSKELAVAQVLKAKNAKIIPSAEQIAQFPKLLNEKERQWFSIAILVLAISTLGFSYSLFDLNRVTVPRTGGEYTEGLIGVPQLINPLYSVASDVDSDLVALIFSGLMKFDAVEGLRTDLAESWSISEDGKTYTFVLRDDAMWHDGADVRAEDVVFTFNALQNVEYRSPLELSFSGIKVERVDERTVRFILTEPFAPFLSMLTVGILPSHVWQEIQPINATVAELNRKPIGSGPYMVEKIVRDSRGNVRSYTLSRHDKYHGEKPYINKINLRFYPDFISAIEALRNRNVEGLAYLPVDYLSEFKNLRGVQILQPAMQQYTALYFNQSKNILLQNIDFRKALAHATDRDTLISNALNGSARPIDSFLLPGMPGYNPEISGITYNPDEVGRILDGQGWTIDEESGFRKKGNDILSLTLTVVEAPDLLAVARNLAEQWAELGIMLNIRAVNTAIFQNEIIKSNDYEILLSGLLYGNDPDPYPFWHSSQTRDPGLNLALFSNRRADEKIETGRTSNDVEVRAQAYRELEEIMMIEIPAIFLYQPLYPYATATKINGQNLERIVNPYQRFSTISEWYIKTRRIFEGR